MKEYLGVIINADFLSLFYIIRCLVLNVNILFSIVCLIEGLLVVSLLANFFWKKYRTKKNGIKTAIHISMIGVIFLFLGHIISICTLQLYHFRAIEVFEKNQSTVPVAERINGKWILEVPEFSITEQEIEILKKNFEKSSPCFFEAGCCYFELGGFLNNSGGYCLMLNGDIGHVPLAFGFLRINRTVRLIGNWRYYE